MFWKHLLSKRQHAREKAGKPGLRIGPYPLPCVTLEKSLSSLSHLIYI